MNEKNFVTEGVIKGETPYVCNVIIDLFFISLNGISIFNKFLHSNAQRRGLVHSNAKGRGPTSMGWKVHVLISHSEMWAAAFGTYIDIHTVQLFGFFYTGLLGSVQQSYLGVVNLVISNKFQINFFFKF